MDTGELQTQAGTQSGVHWRKKVLAAAVVCPDCRKSLIERAERLACPACDSEFQLYYGVPKIYPPSRAAALEASIAGFHGARAGVRQSRFFRALLPPNPICDPGDKAREARVKAAMPDGLVVNLGSKSDNWGAHVANLDLVLPLGESGNVDILGDIERLPFGDATVDGIICTSVLEHVANSMACIQEIVRVVKPGGHIYVTVPFIFPTHPDPLDRWRWTLDGLRHSLSAFHEISAGPCGGPFSAYLAVTPTLMASMFSNFYLFNAVRFALGWLLWPVKFLDYLACRSDKAYMAPANFYFFGRKV